MSAIGEIVAVLKSSLKQHGLTYANVAEHLGMSEASVKRMFSEKHFSLARIESICNMMGMDFLDLLHTYEKHQYRISHLTLEQEQELANNVKLLLTAVCVRNHLGFQDIVRIYDIEEHECTRALVRLDKLGLIELLPKNAIKLKIEEDFRWLPGGPIEQFYKQYVQPDFLDSEFDTENANRVFLTGMVSERSQQYLLKKSNELMREFAKLIRQDANVETSNKFNIGLFIAQRPWELSMLKAMHRKTKQKRQTA